MTFLATALLSAWLAVAGSLGWLAGGASVTAVALIGQATPTIAAWIMRRLGREGWADAGFRRASLRWYLQAWGLGVVLPASAAALSALMGWGEVALTWGALAANINALGFSSLPSEPAPVIGFLLMALLVWPWLLGIFALGEEVGWRGYLLPRLLAFGRRKALVLSGLLWSVWHIPLVLVGQAYPGYPVAGLLLIFPFMTGVGVILGYLRLQSSSVFVTALLHGTLNAQTATAVAVVTPHSTIYGGFMGVVGIAVVWVVAIWLLWCDSDKVLAERDALRMWT